MHTNHHQSIKYILLWSYLIIIFLTGKYMMQKVKRTDSSFVHWSLKLSHFVSTHRTEGSHSKGYITTEDIVIGVVIYKSIVLRKISALLLICY